MGWELQVSSCSWVQLVPGTWEQLVLVTGTHTSTCCSAHLDTGTGRHTSVSTRAQLSRGGPGTWAGKNI